MTIIEINSINLRTGLINYTCIGDAGTLGPYDAPIDWTVANPTVGDYLVMAVQHSTDIANGWSDGSQPIIDDIKAGGSSVSARIAETVREVSPDNANAVLQSDNAAVDPVPSAP